MKKNLFLLTLIALSFFTACSDDKDGMKELNSELINAIPEFTIQAEGDITETTIGKSISFAATIDEDAEVTAYSWQVNGKEVSTTPEFDFQAEEAGEYTVTLGLTFTEGSSSQSVKVKVNSLYGKGTFVLNEGNMTTENGFLTYISPAGEITDSIYYKANEKPLGNTTQDMYLNNGKAYFISQNGGRKGGDMIVIADAGNMKKLMAFDSEVNQTLSWPTNIAVVDDNHVYIRDNHGVSLFNPQDVSLNLIEGTNGANKNRMLVLNSKLYFACGNKLCAVSVDTKTMEVEMPGKITGIIKSDDGNIFVACSSRPAQILKVNPADGSVIKANEVEGATLSSGWSEFVAPSISAKGDSIYFSDAKMVIKRHIFSTGETTELTDVRTHIENAGIVYNSLAVHPITGEVYFNTIKGYGWDFLVNDILIFNFSTPEVQLVEDYKNHTHFPVGVFFTESFHSK